MNVIGGWDCPQCHRNLWYDPNMPGHSHPGGVCHVCWSHSVQGLAESRKGPIPENADDEGFDPEEVETVDMIEDRLWHQEQPA